MTNFWNISIKIRHLKYIYLVKEVDVSTVNWIFAELPLPVYDAVISYKEFVPSYTSHYKKEHVLSVDVKYYEIDTEEVTWIPEFWLYEYELGVIVGDD
jgi:hypothetical protein